MKSIVRWEKNVVEATSEYILETKLGFALQVIWHEDVILSSQWVLDDRPQQSIMLDARTHSIKDFLNPKTNHTCLALKFQGTDFQRRVWQLMTEIPVGEVQTYSALAKRLDSGARAVANACRANPFPLLVPCHRVVAVQGLGGYMGAVDGVKLEIKRRLLELEALQCQILY